MNSITNVPIIPLRSLVVFPYTSVSVDVTRESNIKAINFAVKNKIRVVAVMQKDASTDQVDASDLHSVGTLCDVAKIVRIDDKTLRLYLDGISVVDIGEYDKNKSIMTATIYERDKMPALEDKQFQAFKAYVLSNYKTLSTECNRNYPSHIKKALDECDNIEMLVSLGAGLIAPLFNKYELLITESPKSRAEILCEMLGEDVSYSKRLAQIEQKVLAKLNKSNQNYVLREQMRAIQEEIGEGEEDVNNALKESIVKLVANDEIKSKLNKEVVRLSRMNESAPEASVIRNYLEWAIGLPWGNMTEEKCNLNEVRAILDEDHYGINEVKERILEYLAVKKMTETNSRGTAICLAGPPGVGKTSIAKSIARALGKEYIQLTLGGVHDEAEIRGHRKTYIGSMPGRIMSSLSKAKTNNPVFLLDEVDKITKDMRGDPQAALLEVLDPNQNKQFRDNYLEIPYDLSSIMFILTANDLSSLDKPLLDRLEVINMDGYTTEEKISIAEKYLIRKQSIEHGLKDGVVQIPSEILRDIVEGYTSESGVRELERKIAAIIRKIVYNAVVGDKLEDSYIVDKVSLVEYLGARKNPDIREDILGEVGRVTGLAWTSLGGVTLNIEAVVTEGSGELKLTGSLGDVMKESAHTALTLVKKLVADMGFGVEYFKKHDIHIHVPMGAVPKDGPSAGITMTCAIYSAVTGLKSRDMVAMTGEISLSGRVLPIGGLKEKALAAHRIGIKTVVIPSENKKDLEKLPKCIMDDVRFVPVDKINEVLSEVISQ